MISPSWETVHTIDGWYDGPRSGAAEYGGVSCWYRSVYLDTNEWNPDEDRFELTPITQDVLSWELERTAIFDRWDAARKDGSIVWKNGDLDSFGALPDEMMRYRELNEKVEAFLTQASPKHFLRGNFDLTTRRVRWDPLET